MIYNLGISLITTIFLEIISSFILGAKKIADVRLIIIVNVITNPLVVFFSNIIFLLSNYTILFFTMVFILEIWAVLFEFILFKRYLQEEIMPLMLSICNNFFSFVIGILIFK